MLDENLFDTKKGVTYVTDKSRAMDIYNSIIGGSAPAQTAGSPVPQIRGAAPMPSSGLPAASMRNPALLNSLSQLGATGSQAPAGSSVPQVRGAAPMYNAELPSESIRRNPDLLNSLKQPGALGSHVPAGSSVEGRNVQELLQGMNIQGMPLSDLMMLVDPARAQELGVFNQGSQLAKALAPRSNTRSPGVDKNGKRISY